MTDEQRQQIKRLSRCRFLPGSFDKRFVGDMSMKTHDYELTEKQAAYLDKLIYKYRKQLPETK